jgi:hypothetical protein
MGETEKRGYSSSPVDAGTGCIFCGLDLFFLDTIILFQKYFYRIILTSNARSVIAAAQ